MGRNERKRRSYNQSNAEPLKKQGKTGFDRGGLLDSLSCRKPGHFFRASYRVLRLYRRIRV